VLIIASILALFIAYLFGSIPVGYLVARAYKIDITASGSGRTGGTNVLRAAGPLAAGLTVAGDLFKGLIPVYVLRWFFPVIVVMVTGESSDTLEMVANLVVALSMPAAVLGHNHSIFLGFKGGVGGGTAVGTLGGISVIAAILTALFAVIALAISRYASILSTTVAVSGVVLFIIFAALGQIDPIFILGAVANLLIIVYALRPNYARLRAGTERRVGDKTENITKIN